MAPIASFVSQSELYHEGDSAWEFSYSYAQRHEDQTATYGFRGLGFRVLGLRCRDLGV